MVQVIQKVDMAIGSSIMAGFLSLLKDVPVDEMTRYVGAAAVQPPPPPMTSVQRPYELRVPGARIFTPRRPYSTNISRTITATGAATVTYSAPTAAPTGFSWVYIRINSTGQGGLRKVTDHAAAGPDFIVTVGSAWSPAIAADGTVHFLQDSHTIAGIDTPRTKITRVTGASGGAGDAPDFTSAVVGRFVNFFDDDSVRLITGFTADSITVDSPLGGTPAVGGGFCILTGANSVETIADIANPAKCVLQDLTIYLDPNAPVLLTGLDYCNYDATPFQSPKVAYAAGPTVNSILELQFQLRTRRAGPVVLIQWGVSASMVSPFLNGAVYSPAPTYAFATYFSWLHDSLSLDFNPGSPRALYQCVTNAITCTTALLVTEGLTAQYESCFINLADNDSGDDDRILLIGSNFTLLRNSLRTFTGCPGMLFIMSGPARYAGTDATRQLVYDQLGQIQEDDLDSQLFDTRVFVYPADFAGDGLHLSALGEIKLGKGYGTSWQTVRARSNAAARVLAELPTLAGIRTKVRRRYERTDSGSNSLAGQMDMFINDSLREIYTTLGDSAWFLRVVETVSLSTTFPGTIELPRKVRRFLGVERVSCPGARLVVKGLAYNEQGRVQVTLHDYGGGPFVCHFIQNPKELVAESDAAPVPVEYVELVVMLTCKRLAENTGNMGLATYYAAETERLWRLLKREAQRYDRMRQGQLEGLGVYDSWRNGSYPTWMEAL
jgi:hypothetical protein